jgi:hypothetical protein
MLTERSGRWALSLAALPHPATPEDYARAAEEIESLLSSLPAIVAVYRTGSVSAPGISDLDRIAVVERDVSVPPIWPRLSERSRRVAMHTPFLADVDSFRQHRTFAFVEPLELASGESVQIDARPLPEYSEPLIAAESLVVGLVRAVKQTTTGRLKVRSLLCELNNLRHALTLGRLGRTEGSEAWAVADDVAELRARWFELPDVERRRLVCDLAGRTAPALVGALGALGERVDLAPARRELRLGPPWSNVVLVADARATGEVRGAPRPGSRLARSARLSELRWRRARPRIPVHPGVLALLASGGAESGERGAFRDQRDRVVRDYRAFLATQGRGYSGLGFASAFVEG